MTSVATDEKLVYVVDDDVVLSRLVAVNLEARGFRVKQFESGTGALQDFGGDEPDLVILDILMPELNGLQVTKRIREFSQVPILMLTVRNETSAKLSALNLGADDYLTKPFRIDELLARVRAILRRTTLSQERNVYSYHSGELSVDLVGLRVLSHGKSVHLTPHEWSVLRVLIRHGGRVVSARQLLKEAWGPNYGEEGDYIRTYVTRLRRKIEPDPRLPRYLLLERGLGYRMADPD